MYLFIKNGSAPAIAHSKPKTINAIPDTSKGILLIALGAPEYGLMAANLAASIRYKDPGIAIHLVHTERSISMLGPMHRALFTSFAECPLEYYTRPATDLHHPPEFIKAKTHLYELTPFEETLFLDVDMLILPHTRISDVMQQLSAQCDFTIKNRGWQGLNSSYTHWFDVEEAKRFYKTKGRFYQCQSEFIFFKKTKKNAAFFKKVRKVFDERPLPAKDFRGGVPDEYAYNIAIALTGNHPHKDCYLPIYWHFLDGRRDWNKSIVRGHIGFSLGGEHIPSWIMQKVNAYKQLYRQSLKLPHLFNVPPKKRWGGKRIPI